MRKRIAALVLCATLLCNSSVYAMDLTSDETAGTTLVAPTEESTEEIIGETEAVEESTSAFPELEDLPVVEEPSTEEPVVEEEDTTEEPAVEEVPAVEDVVDAEPDVKRNPCTAKLPSYTENDSLCANFAVDDYPWLQGGYRVIWVGGIPFYVAVSESFDSILDRIMTSVREYPGSTWAIMKCDDSLDVDTVSKAVEIFEVDDVLILRYDSEKTAKRDTKSLEKLDSVKFAELDAEMQTETEVTEVTPVSGMNGNYNPNAPIVAILDTGISLSDEGLIGRITDDGINLTDDTDESVLDKHGHGTLMAQIVADKSGGNVRILPVKIANDRGEATILSAFLGIKYAEKHGADIINFSMVTVDSVKSKCLEYAIDCANQVVVSAGNQGSDVSKFSPANVENAIVVSAVNEDGTFAEYSNYGDTVDISACGDYGESHGTSCAAAVVSGLLCNNTYEELVATGQDLGDEGWDEYYGDATVSVTNLEENSVCKCPSRWNGFVLGSDLLRVQGTGGTVYPGGRHGYCFFVVDGSTYRLDIDVGTEQVLTHYWTTLTWSLQSGADGTTCDSGIWTQTDNYEFVYPDRYSPGDREYNFYFNIYTPKPGHHLYFSDTSGGYQSSIVDYGDGWSRIHLNTNDIGLTNWGPNGLYNHCTIGASYAPNTYTMTLNDYAYNPNTGVWDHIGTRTESAVYGSVYTPSYSTPTNYHNHSREWDGGWTVTGDGTFAVYYCPITHTMTSNHYLYNPITGNWDYWTTTTATADYGSVYTPSYSTPRGYHNYSRDWDGGWTVSSDGTFNVYYYPNTHNLYVNPNGGSYNSSTDVTTFNTVFNTHYYNGIGVPSRTGYTFAGWYTADGTPVWDTNGYAIQYGGNTTYWKNGYDWNASWMGGCYRDWDHMLWNYDADLTIYAHWTPNQYKCSFNGNGGTVSAGTNPITFTYDSNGFCLGCAPTASRTGFTFLGWYTAASGGQQSFDTGGNWYNKDTNVAAWSGWQPDGLWYGSSRTARWVCASDATMYAQWKRNKYTVTYNCTENGGSTANFTASVYYDYDIDFSKTATKTGDTGAYSSSNPDGWQFVGWNTNKNATTGMTSMKMPAKNVTLYAIYKKTITAKFRQYEYTGTDTCANVSSVTNTSKSKTVYNKTTTAELKENTRKSVTGWTCDGWTTGTAEKSGITTNFTISKDTQYYMRYSRYVQANFISEKTTVSLGGTRYRNSANINSSSPIALTTPAMKSKTGWTQVGWTTSKKANAAASLKQKTAYSLYDNISFYGVYTKGVTVSYDANGGESTPASGTKTAYYNTAGNVLYPSFVTASPIHKNAVAFKNWNTEANGSGTAFASDTSAVFQDSQKLYATFDNIGVTGVVLDTTNLSLLVGESKKITATVQPATATHENMIYESEDTDVATVDTTGNVTGVSTGVTNIIAYSADNPDASAKCQVVISSGSVSVPEKLVLGSQGKITLKNNSTSDAKSSLYLAGLSNLVGVESGKEYALVFDVLNGTEAVTKEVDNVIVSTTGTDSILFTVHPNVALSSLLPDKYNATIRYKLVIER